MGFLTTWWLLSPRESDPMIQESTMEAVMSLMTSLRGHTLLRPYSWLIQYGSRLADTVVGGRLNTAATEHFLQLGTGIFVPGVVSEKVSDFVIGWS